MPGDLRLQPGRAIWVPNRCRPARRVPGELVDVRLSAMFFQARLEYPPAGCGPKRGKRASFASSAFAAGLAAWGSDVGRRKTVSPLTLSEQVPLVVKLGPVAGREAGRRRRAGLAAGLVTSDPTWPDC